MSLTIFVVASKPEVKRKIEPPKVHPVEKNPLVSFYYPDSKTGVSTARSIWLIGANQKYYIGVEIAPCTKAKFKRFLRCKATYLSILRFNPESIK